MALFDSIRKQLSALGDERAQLLIKLEKARQRREDLQTLPLPLDEHIDKLCTVVDLNGAQFAETFRRRTEPHDNKPFSDMNPVAQFVSDNGPVSGQTLQRLICGIFPDEVKAGIKRQVQTWDWPKAGPPLREREAEMVKLDKTIAGLEDKLKEFDSLATQTGVEIGQARGDQIKHQGLGRAPNSLRKGN